MKRKPHPDPVTPELREEVITRDLRYAGGCVARFLDARHKCADYWGRSSLPDYIPALSLDHAQDGYGRMGKRAPSNRAHLVTICFHGHLLGWATRNRPLLREYLERVEREPDGCTHVEPVFGCASCQRRTDPLQLGETA